MNRGPMMDRALEPAWLDAALHLATSREPDAGRRLEIFLRDRVPSVGGRKKTVTVLKRVWIQPPLEAAPLIDWGIQRASEVGDVRVLHVGAMFGSHPFFGDVCALIGQGFRMGRRVQVADVARAMRGRWGDRDVVDVGTRAVIRTLRWLDLLGGRKGAKSIVPGTRVRVPNFMVPWLTHALLLTRGLEEIDARAASTCPEFFMFEVPPPRDVGYPFLERFNEGDSRTVLRLRGERRTSLQQGQLFPVAADGRDRAT
jgi:hypothetical protein